jgi:hypothetical protein
LCQKPDAPLWFRSAGMASSVNSKPLDLGTARLTEAVRRREQIHTLSRLLQQTHYKPNPKSKPIRATDSSRPSSRPVGTVGKQTPINHSKLHSNDEHTMAQDAKDRVTADIWLTWPILRTGFRREKQIGFDMSVFA